MDVGLYTLGCKVNQYETQAMEAALRAAGHKIVPFDAPADSYIINTCTVTAVSDRKSRAAIRRARRLNPLAVVAVCGCYAQTDPDAVAALDVDLVGGSADRMDFLHRLEALAGVRAQGAPRLFVDQPRCRTQFELLPAGGLEGRTRALIKLEDGCTNFCSYCIIPHARGPVRSLPLDAAAQEAARLRDEGFREIVLTGIEIASYGRDLPGKPSLTDVLEAVCTAAGSQVRIRLGSLEPRMITQDFCRRAAALPNLCAHVHLSLQSGCDQTLRRMGRRYDTARFWQSVCLLRETFGDPGLTADLIVGFPGETEAEFSQTLEFIRRCGFSSMHIFPYSRRKGTPAAVMPDQVPQRQREERARRAAAVAAEAEGAFRDRCIGKTVSVLFETEEDGSSQGHAENYVPVSVRETGLRGQTHLVTIEGLSPQGLRGVRLRSDKIAGEGCADDRI